MTSQRKKKTDVVLVSEERRGELSRTSVGGERGSVRLSAVGVASLRKEESDARSRSSARVEAMLSTVLPRMKYISRPP